MNELLHNLLCVQSKSGNCTAMHDHLIEHFQSIGCKVHGDTQHNLYITKGESATYPCAVAHMDTVHRIEEGGITPIELDGNVMGINRKKMAPIGIGGDDKCGIYAVMCLAASLPAFKGALFVDEEIGCVGSNACYLPFFKNCRFVLQADRRGNSDWVDSISGEELGSTRFQRHARKVYSKYGFKPTGGAMTDVQALCKRRVGVSVANMSAGYYNPHDDCEYINLADLQRTIDMMREICVTMTATYRYVAPERKYSNSVFGSWVNKHLARNRTENTDRRIIIGEEVERAQKRWVETQQQTARGYAVRQELERRAHGMNAGCAWCGSSLIDTSKVWCIECRPSYTREGDEEQAIADGGGYG